MSKTIAAGTALLLTILIGVTLSVRADQTRFQREHRCPAVQSNYLCADGVVYYW